MKKSSMSIFRQRRPPAIRRAGTPTRLPKRSGGQVFYFGAILILILISIFIPFSFAQEEFPFQKGLILANTGQYQSAIIELNKVIEMEPGHATAYLVLGICYTETGEYDKAVQSLEKIKDKLPESEVLHYTLALLYEKEKKWREADLSWQKFLSLTKDKELKEIARKHLKQISEHLKE